MGARSMAGRWPGSRLTADVAAVVLAAGHGSRMEAPVNKVFLLVRGKPILAWALDLFESHPQVSEVVLVVSESERERCMHRIIAPFGFSKVHQLIGGGQTRHESEFLGLKALEAKIRSGQVSVAVVHDAVRPFATRSQLDALLTTARRTGAAILAMPASAEVVTVAADGSAMWPQESLWEAQTPQAFDAGLILDAHKRAADDDFHGTDTASVLERLGYPVAVVEGSCDNIKVTTAEDLVMAEHIAKQRGETGWSDPALDRVWGDD